LVTILYFTPKNDVKINRNELGKENMIIA